MPPTLRSRYPVLLLVVSLILAACAAPPSASTPTPKTVPSPSPNATPTPTEITITDALGRTVTFARSPQRIVTVGKALFMIADAIYLFPEIPSRVVAIGKTMQNKLDFISAIDPNYASKTILESGAGAEQVAAVKPDVVLLKSSVAESLGKLVEALGIPVVYIDFETPEQYRRDVMTLGQLFQDEARATQLLASFQSRVDRVSQAVADLKEEQKPRVLLLYYSEKEGTVAFNIPPLQWIQTMLVQIGGGYPVWEKAQIGSGWTKVTLEQIATWDADQIYVVAYSGSVDDAVKKLKADPQWQALRAVKEGKLYAFPADYYSWDEPDPRWILGLTWLAAKMNPDRFRGLDMQVEIRAFYRDFYGMDDATYQKIVQPYLVGDLP